MKVVLLIILNSESIFYTLRLFVKNEPAIHFMKTKWYTTNQHKDWKLMEEWPNDLINLIS
jgi:hypothetical protein